MSEITADLPIMSMRIGQRVDAKLQNLAAASPLEMTTADRPCSTFTPLLPRFCLGHRGWAHYHESRRHQRCVAAT